MTIKTDNYQIGVNVTPTNNFTLVTDAAGGMKLARGNPGGTTQDILTVNSDGQVTLVNPTLWVASSPTPVPSSGTFGSALAEMRTLKVGRIVWVQLSFIITNMGTVPANVPVAFALPYTPAATIGGTSEWNVFGRESQISGFPVTGWIRPGPALITILPFPSYGLAAGQKLNVSGFYETST